MAEQVANVPGWFENATAARYLEALSAWLIDCPGYYENAGLPMPSNPWQIVQDALHAAAVYE